MRGQEGRGGERGAEVEDQLGFGRRCGGWGRDGLGERRAAACEGFPSVFAEVWSVTAAAAGFGLGVDGKGGGVGEVEGHGG